LGAVVSTTGEKRERPKTKKGGNLNVRGMGKPKSGLRKKLGLQVW